MTVNYFMHVVWNLQAPNSARLWNIIRRLLFTLFANLFAGLWATRSFCAVGLAYRIFRRNALAFQLTWLMHRALIIFRLQSRHSVGQFQSAETHGCSSSNLRPAFIVNETNLQIGRVIGSGPVGAHLRRSTRYVQTLWFASRGSALFFVLIDREMRFQCRTNIFLIHWFLVAFSILIQFFYVAVEKTTV